MLLPIECQNYKIRRKLLETAPTLPGNVKEVLYDDGFLGRISIFGYPNSDEVYYTVEVFRKDFSLVSAHTSEIFENIAALNASLEREED